MSQKYSRETVMNWYSIMVKIRNFENILDDYNKNGKLYGTTHLYNGEEAIATAICTNLEDKDLILSTHRNHGHAIAKGTDTYKMFAEIFGKEVGTNGGRGGSMHISDISIGNIGGNGIVGGNYPVALGLAHAIKMDEKDQIVVCFSGDGATNEGTFHESLNLASIWKLPIVFVIENNQYAMSSDSSKMIAGNIADRASIYNMPSHKVDGQNIFQVAQVFEEIKEELKSGPVLLEAKTYRFKGHSRSDAQKYRSKEEFLNHEDPIVTLKDILIKDYEVSADEISSIDEKIHKSLIDEAQQAFKEKDASLDYDNLGGAVYAK